MWKKLILCGVLVALGGAIAIVGAQEKNRPPSILVPNQARPIQSATSPPATGELTSQLQSAQRAVVEEYGNGANSLRAGSPSQMTHPQMSQPIRQTGGSLSLGYRQDDDVEVPAILSGAKSTPKTAQANDTPPAQPTAAPNAPPTAPPTATGAGTAGAPRSDTNAPRVASRPVEPTKTASDNGPSVPTLPKPAADGPRQTPRLNPAASEQVNPMVAPSVPDSGNAPQSINAPGQLSLDSESPIANSGESVDRMSLDSLGPQLRVSGAGPQTTKVGKPATYKIQVRNISNVSADHATVRTILPEWVSVIDATSSQGSIERVAQGAEHAVAWKLDQVGPTSMAEMELQIIVNENREFDLKTEWQCDPVHAQSHIGVTQPRLEMAIAGPEDVVFGEKVTMNISVANPGNGGAENVVVQLPEALGGERMTLGSIEPGGLETFQVEMTPREKGLMKFAAVVTADGGMHESCDHKLNVRRAELEVSLEVPPFKFAGSPAEVKLVVTNTGDAPAQSVMAAAVIPEGVKYEGGVSEAEAVEGGLTWNVGDLAPGARMQYTLQCTMTQSGVAHFEAGVRDKLQLGAADAADTQVEAVAELVLEVKDPKGPRSIGEEVIYELTIRNRGTKSATNIHLIAQFSEGIDPTEGVGMKSEIADGQVVFEPVPRVNAGEEVTVRVKAKASVAGNHVFRAHLTCNDPDTHRVFEGTTRYFDVKSRLNQASGDSPSDQPPAAIPSLRGPK